MAITLLSFLISLGHAIFSGFDVLGRSFLAAHPAEPLFR
jgi:hypothetical protein